MILTKKQLLVAGFAGSPKDKNRPTLAGILVTPTATWATDSYVLAMAKDARKRTPEDEPIAAPVVISAEDVEAVRRGLKKAEYVDLKTDTVLEGRVTLHNGGSTMEAAKIEGAYPEVEKLLAEKTAEPAKFKIMVNAEYLARAAKFAGEAGKNRGTPWIELEFRDPSEPLILKGYGFNDEEGMLALVMPVRR